MVAEQGSQADTVSRQVPFFPQRAKVGGNLR